MKPSLILFDFDLTLVDATGCLFSALRKGLAAAGAPDAPDEVLKRLIGIPLPEQFEALAPGMDRKALPLFKRAYGPERDRTEVAGSKLIPGVREALQNLQGRGIQLGIVSRGATDRIERSLSRFQIDHFFGPNAVIGGASDKANGILNGIARFRAQENATMYVGDRPDDCDAAQRAAVSFVGVTSGAFMRDDFPSDCVILRSVADLPEFLKTS